MKLKKNFVLRQIAGTWVVLALGEASVDFNGMLRLNETGAAIWRALEQGNTQEQVAEALVAEYEITHEDAQTEVAEFLETLTKIGCVEA